MDITQLNRADISGRIEAFLDAAYRADYRTISNNLAYGLSPDVVDDDNTTALQIASAQGNLHLMQMLLNSSASVDKCNHCGFTPLLHAARNGKAQAVELLIRHGADPFRTTFYGTTALSLAFAGGHLNIMVMLREYVSQTRRRAPTPLIAAIATKQYEVVIHLELAGMLRHPCCDMFYELDAFHVAEQLMDLKMVALLRDLDLQLMNTPAMYCFVPRKPISQGSQVKITKKTVDIRCLIRDHEVALVDWIMDVNDYSVPAGTTPLMYAAIAGNISMASQSKFFHKFFKPFERKKGKVRMLLQHNCDMNAAYHGFTPIMIAIVCGNDTLTQYLIKKGASQSTDGFQFSLFELASNSDGISSKTIRLILTGSMQKRLSALLQKISRQCGMSQPISHQPVNLERNASQLSFSQKVVENMGLKSHWVPEELFDALSWPDSPDTYFEISNSPYDSRAAPTPLLDERIMVKADEQEQFRCLMNDYFLSKCAGKDCSSTRSSNFDKMLSLVDTNRLHVQQRQSSSISRLQSILFHFGSSSPKNYSMTLSNSTNLSMEANDWDDSVISEDTSELSSTYKYEKKYWDFLNARCSPDMCQKLEEQEIDCETFLMLTKTEFISFGINRSDVGILNNIQKMLKEELSKI